MSAGTVAVAAALRREPAVILCEAVVLTSGTVAVPREAGAVLWWAVALPAEVVALPAGACDRSGVIAEPAGLSARAGATIAAASNC